MFEFDRSAARGNMAVRKLYVFKHSSALGDAPSWKLFDSINVHKRDGADVARNFSDYEVQVNREAIPDSVSVSEMVDPYIVIPLCTDRRLLFCNLRSTLCILEI